MNFNNKLALGTVQFGLAYGIANPYGKVASKEVTKILQCAKSYGLDTLDTAVEYGESETLLGSLGIHSWKVVTKLPVLSNGHSDINKWVQQETLQSMARLGVSQLHGLLLHRPGQLLESFGGELYEALQAVKAQGLVNKIGVSVYGPEELDRLLDRYPVDLVQTPLNILDRRLLESGWAKRLHAAGVEVHTRSTFLQGLLLMPSHQRPAKFSYWSGIWSEWHRWLAETGLSPLQACLRYANGLPDIDRVVVGVDSVVQLDEIINAANGTLSSLPAFEPLQDKRLINPVSWSQL